MSFLQLLILLKFLFLAGDPYPVKISQNHKKIRSELQVVLERRTQANKHFLS